MSYDSWKNDAPDPGTVSHYPDGECECHCHRCGAALELDPYFGTYYAACGDCDVGREPDGEVFRAGEAAAYEREQQCEAQKLKR